MNVQKIKVTQSGDFGDMKAKINLNKLPFSSDKKQFDNQERKYE